MARQIPKNRFDELVRAATEVFISSGYRLTQMSDIAQAMGIAKGTLYGYVESKEALLAVCLQHADNMNSIGLPETLPVASLPAGELGLRVKQQVSIAVAQPMLAQALEKERVEDPVVELVGIIGEFYDMLFANRHRVKLLDRCVDNPELQGLWQSHGREQTRLAFTQYFEKRIGAGQIRAVSDTRLAARMLIETVATWAVHIHWDPAPESYDHGEMRSNAIDFLVRGLSC